MQLQKIVLALALLIGLTVTASAQTAGQSERREAFVQDIVFKNIEGKDSIRNLARNLELNVVFDDAAKSKGKLAFSLHQVTMRQTLSIVLVMLEWRAKQLDEKTLIVFPDTPEMLQKYGQLKDWSYKQP